MTIIFIALVIVLVVFINLIIFRILDKRALKSRIDQIKDDIVIEKKTQKTKKKSLINIKTGKEDSYFSRKIEKNRLLLLRGDFPLRVEEYLMFKALLMSIGFLLIYLMAKNLLLALIFSLLFYIAPDFILKRKIKKRLEEFNGQLVDGLTLFSNSLKAGYSYLQGINSIVREMEEPISKEFGIVLKEMSLGIDIEKSLDNMSRRVDSDDFKLMVTAMKIQRETGGNLSEILDNISGTIRDRIKLKNEIKTLTAQGRMSGTVVSLMPFVLGAFLFLANRDYMMELIIHPWGKWILLLGLVNEVIGIYMIKRIIRIVD
jgi:tight adherence protein B